MCLYIRTVTQSHEYIVFVLSDILGRIACIANVRPTATAVAAVARSVGLCPCVLVTSLSSAETDELIEMPFGRRTPVDLCNHASYAGLTLAPSAECD